MHSLSAQLSMVQQNRTIREGLVVGFIGSASAAVFYGVFDILSARGAFFTADVLGKSVFRGLRDPAVLQLPMQLDWAAIAWYSGLHLIITLIIGLIVVGLVVHSERRPSHARMVFGTIVAGFVVTIVAVGLLTSPMRTLLPWWSVVVANAFAVLAAGTYLLRKHPDAWNRLSPFGG